MSEIKRYSNTPEFVERRNKRLHEFFVLNGLGGEVRFIGDENKPAVLFKDEFVLPCFVRNFDLIFTDGDAEVKRYRLAAKTTVEPDTVKHLVETLPKRKVHRIALEGKRDMLVCGWNYRGEKRHPVFSGVDPKIYFDRAKADVIVNELKALGYECEII